MLISPADAHAYDSVNKQKQYKEPLRNKETNCQWMLE